MKEDNNDHLGRVNYRHGLCQLHVYIYSLKFTTLQIYKQIFHLCTKLPKVTKEFNNQLFKLLPRTMYML